MPVYRKGPDSWRVRVWHRGTRRDWVVKGTKAEAERFEAVKRLEITAREPSERRTAPRFDAACSEYLNAARAELAPATYRNRTYQVTALAETIDAKIDRLSSADLDRFVAARRDEGIGEATIADDLKILKVILNHARRQGWPVTIPAKWPRLRLEKPNPRERVKTWTAEEILRLVGAAEKSLRPVIRFLANTGCRKSEAVHLRCRSVDFAGGVVWIEPVRDSAGEVVWQPKDREARAVPLNEALAAELRPLVRGQRPEAHVFRGPRGRGWVMWPQKRFDAARKAAGLVGGPHTLRHTYASHFLHAGGDLFVLARILGHSHARTTEVYSHLLPGAVAGAGALVSLGDRTRHRTRRGAGRKKNPRKP